MKESRNKTAAAPSNANDIAKIRKTLELCERTMIKTTHGLCSPSIIRTGKRALIKYHQHYQGDGVGVSIYTDYIGTIQDVFFDGPERTPHISLIDGCMVMRLSMDNAYYTGEENFKTASLPIEDALSITYIGG